MSSFDKPCENIEARPIGALDQDHESEGAGREARGLEEWR
jgi:hypothetical protein